MRTIHTTPTLRAKTSTGKDKFWRGIVLSDDDGNHYRSSEAWTVNAVGERSKALVATPARVEPKNVGRANETTPLEQALLEVNAAMQKKIDKGYAAEGRAEQAGNGFILPMLAHAWNQKRHVTAFPLMAQPKFDGTRMLMNNRLGCWSRQGKPYLDEVVAHLRFDTEHLTLDGELILPDGYSFQDTIRAIKKYRPETTPRLLYRVYDVVDEDLGALERQLLLIGLRERLTQHQPHLLERLVFTPYTLVENEQELAETHSAFVAAGFEGTMLRTLDGRYTPGHRSAGLLKHKDFDDAEYEIVDFTDGIGKDAHAIVFICQAGERTFQVRPMGTIEERRRMYQAGATFIGKPLTVRYQGLSEDGIPRFPVGIAVREVD